MSKDSSGVRLSEEQRPDWLCLIRSDNLGPRTFRALVNHYRRRTRGAGGAALPERRDVSLRVGIDLRERAIARANAAERDPNATLN